MAWNPNDPNDPNNPNKANLPKTPEQRKGSGFTGARQIMQANVGQRLGQQITGQIGQAGQRVQQQAGEAAKKFQTQLGQAQQQYGTAYGTAGTAVQGVVSGQPVQPVQPVQPIQPVQQPQVGAIAPQFDPATLAAYQTAVSGEYKGPTGLEDYADLEAQAELAKQMGEAGLTTGGRMDLLQRTFGRGERQYTASQAALDAMLLGKSAKELAAAKRQSADIFEDVQSEQDVAQAKARQAGAEVSAQAKALSQKMGATEAQELAKVKAQKVDYEKKLSDLSQKVQQEVASGELSKDTLNALKSLGIDEKTQFYGMEPAEIAKLIATKDPSQISEASVADEEQIRKLNALRRLAGKKDVFSQADVERAGTTRDPSAAFKFAGDLGTTLQKQKESFEGVLGGVISEQEKANIEQAKAREAALQEELKNLPKNEQRFGEQGRAQQIQRELANIKRSYGPFFAQSYGGEAVHSDLMNRFLGGELYDKATGKLNVDFANQLKAMLADRKLYAGRTGFLGTGGRVFSADPADAARISALEQLLKRYGTGSTFKAKSES